MSFRLNEQHIIQNVFEATPATEIQLVVQGFPFNYVQRFKLPFHVLTPFRLLSFISTHLENSPHLEFHLLWCLHVFNLHGQYLKENYTGFMSLFRHLQKSIAKQNQDFSKL
jgi:periodic tryptophan protein 2